MATILVVDDQEQNRKLLRMVLEYGGHSLLEAANGTEALALIRERRPQLVVTDLAMPDMGGAELIRSIRSDPAISETRVVLYTATDARLTESAVAASGGQLPVLPKPAEPEQIIHFIGNCLRDAGIQASLRTAVAGSREGVLIADLKTGALSYLQQLRSRGGGGLSPRIGTASGNAVA